MGVEFEKLGGGKLDKAVVYSFLSLILIRSLGGEAVCHQHKTVLYILKLYGAFIFLVLTNLLYIVIYGRGKGKLGRLIRCAAVFKPGGVMIILQSIHGL